MRLQALDDASHCLGYRICVGWIAGEGRKTHFEGLAQMVRLLALQRRVLSRRAALQIPLSRYADQRARQCLHDAGVVHFPIQELDCILNIEGRVQFVHQFFCSACVRSSRTVWRIIDDEQWREYRR